MDILPHKLHNYSIELIGDSCDDIYHYGICDRLSPEAPVPVLKQSRVVVKKGMSSNVRLNLEALGMWVTHHTNTEKLKKHRFIDTRYNQHLLRWDEGEEQPIIPFDIRFLNNKSPPDAVVISDYNKGFLDYEACCKIVAFYKEFDPNIPIFVDTKKKDLTCFEECVIKINEKEFLSIEKKPINAEFVVTLGEKGTRYSNRIYHTNPVEVFDVCGAGDVFLSTLVYGFLRDGTVARAIPIANKMASLSVSHMGTYVITAEDIEKNL